MDHQVDLVRSQQGLVQIGDDYLFFFFSFPGQRFPGIQSTITVSQHHHEN